MTRYDLGGPMVTAGWIALGLTVLYNLWEFWMLYRDRRDRQQRRLTQV
jgi:uncharacterized membrane protein